MPIPKALSQGEESFALHCRVENIKVEREYRFFPDRKWRLDFAIPEEKIGIEIEGITFAGGRHQRIGGYSKDLEKYNKAVLMGWKILRYTTAMVTSGEAINDLIEILNPHV